MDDLTLVDAAASGDDEAFLRRMLEIVAEAVENPGTPARDLAALTKRAKDLRDDIVALIAAREKGGDDGSVEDETIEFEDI